MLRQLGSHGIVGNNNDIHHHQQQQQQCITDDQCDRKRTFFPHWIERARVHSPARYLLRDSPTHARARARAREELRR